MTNSQSTDTRTTEELIQLALAATDEENRSEIIRTLHRRGGQTEFDTAAQLCQSDDARCRELGADILGQLKSDQQDFQTEAVDVLLTLLNDSNEDVLYSPIIALGHRQDERSVSALCALADHLSPEIRSAVAIALGGLVDELALETLIRLTADTDLDTRNWATFGLGSLTPYDTPELREAFLLRATDENHEVRGEALVGLARRGDHRALVLIQQELDQDEIGILVLEACEYLGDPALLPRLQELEAKWTASWGNTPNQLFESQLREAIAACSGNDDEEGG
ncbi:MAG TPA: HEAT repeat domain-containing protein [Acidobacteriota bacterium]|nr:HEAT repeat domain-containing protein [Acidobacteriota bacterium]